MPDADRLLQLVVALDLDVGLRPELVEHRRAARCSSRSNPASFAVASAPSTWSRSAGADRREDQP